MLRIIQMQLFQRQRGTDQDKRLMKRPDFLILSFDSHRDHRRSRLGGNQCSAGFRPAQLSITRAGAFRENSQQLAGIDDFLGCVNGAGIACAALNGKSAQLLAEEPGADLLGKQLRFSHKIDMPFLTHFQIYRIDI